MKKVEFRIIRVIDGIENSSETLTDEQLGLVYGALEELGESWVDNEDDNIHSVCMNKLYNLLEY